LVPLEPSGSLHHRLLLIEADPRHAAQVREVLTQNLPACEVDTEAGPDEALQGLAAQPYGAVILGGGWHQWTGLEFLRLACACASGIPVILLSSGDQEGEPPELAKASGCSPVLRVVENVEDLPGTMADMRDLSAGKSMEQIIQTEKLAALGRLAASLAHEINNPLQALYSSISLLSRGPLDDDKRARYVEIASREVERVVQLVQRMLDFYRPSGQERVLVSLNDLLDDTLALASKQLERCGVEVVKELGPHLPAVEVVAGYLRQVFINLLLYHVEAMPDGGRLTVKTRLEQPGDHLVISFRGTGEAIAADELPYVFEPFYSGKGKSAGPYLAVSYSIVQQHNGSMEVSCEAGQGTTFTVRLPAGGERSV